MIRFTKSTLPLSATLALGGLLLTGCMGGLPAWAARRR